ncbi:MAG: hypothetical protein PHW22_04400 [Bacilli bacterium]|nr:hypothetical protein [Bacilli bacterium]
MSIINEIINALWNPVYTTALGVLFTSIFMYVKRESLLKFHGWVIRTSGKDKFKLKINARINLQNEIGREKFENLRDTWLTTLDPTREFSKNEKEIAKIGNKTIRLHSTSIKPDIDYVELTEIIEYMKIKDFKKEVLGYYEFMMSDFLGKSGFIANNNSFKASIEVILNEEPWVFRVINTVTSISFKDLGITVDKTSFNINNTDFNVEKIEEVSRVLSNLIIQKKAE